MLLLEIKHLRQYSFKVMVHFKNLLFNSYQQLNFKKWLLCAFFLLFSSIPSKTWADVEFMVRGGALTGLWTIDINTSSYTSTRRGNTGGTIAASSLSWEGESYSLGFEYEKSFEERWYYGDAKETSDDNNWTSISTNKVKSIVFFGFGTTGQNMFSFLSTRLGYILKAQLDLGNNILANNPKGTYEGNGVKLSIFYKNIFQTLDWGIDLSLDLNYILYDSLSTNGSTTSLPGTIGNYTYSKLEELSASIMLGISFSFFKNIFEMKPGGEFFRMPGDS